MSQFGRVFRISTFGESHCPSVGVVIDGVPPRLPLTEADIQPQLDRRRPGQSALTTPRSETDTVRIHSGTEHGLTLGTPICLIVPNKDTRPGDYLAAQGPTTAAAAPKSVTSDFVTVFATSPRLPLAVPVSLHAAFIPRPSHADYTYLSKYGVSASSGGGRASARETVARVAAGAVAELILRRLAGVSIVAYVSQVGRASLIRDAIRARRGHARAAGGETAVAAADINDEGWDGVDGWREHDLNSGSDVGDESGDDDEGADQKPANVDTGARARAARPTRRLTRAEVDATAVRCPRLATAAKMEREIKRAAAANDSVGGVVSCVVYGLPAGLGEPCFDKLEAALAQAMLSIPASKGFEIGSGFACAGMSGSYHNDPFVAAPAAATDAAAATPAPAAAAARAGALGRLGFPAPLATASNNSGGIQGGISNGQTINFRVAFKPPATIGKDQNTATLAGEDTVLRNGGRHDPCVAPRAVAVVEAMTALVLADALLLQLGREAAAAAEAYCGRACDAAAAAAAAANAAK